MFVECPPVSSFSHLSTVLGNKFDHGAEAIVPVLFNLIPNCAKVMATSGVSAIRIIIRVSFLLCYYITYILLHYIMIAGIFPLAHLPIPTAHPRPQAHPPDNQQLHIQVCGCKKVRLAATLQT